MFYLEGEMQSNMQKNYYMKNMQKILYVARELHKRGYENLHVVPSISPSGCHWRCAFVVISNSEKQSISASSWIHKFSPFEKEEIIQSPKELCELFEKDNIEFLTKCRGKNHEYVQWYCNMLNKLQEDELPFAFDNSPCSLYFWQTTSENEIEPLPNEYEYYFV
jgi:hypothetical protein